MFGRPISSDASRRAVWKAVSCSVSALPRYGMSLRVLGKSSLVIGRDYLLGMPRGRQLGTLVSGRAGQWIEWNNGIQELNVFARIVNTVFRSPFRSA